MKCEVKILREKKDCRLTLSLASLADPRHIAYIADVKKNSPPP